MILSMLRAALVLLPCVSGTFLRGIQHRKTAPEIETETLDSVWRETKNWMETNGAYLNPGLTLGMKPHGGASIRSLVSTQRVKKGAILATVPHTLFFNRTNFPDLVNVSLKDYDYCSRITRTDIELDNFLNVVGLAIETNKGDESFFAPYIKRLPTLADFKQFHPKFTSKLIKDDFAGLDFLSTIDQDQFLLKHYTRCLRDWQDAAEGQPKGLSKITKDHLALAAVRLQSRAWDGEGLMPMDFSNCGSGKGNTNYWFNEKTDNSWNLKAITDIEPGTEISEQYCDMNNAQLLWSWGVYLENNPWRIKDGNPAIIKNALEIPNGTDCGKSETLKSTVAATLQSYSAGNTMAAPRCRPEVFHQEQGPLRCSLARIAYEECGAFWGFGPPPPISWQGVKQSLWTGLKQFAQANKQEEAKEDKVILVGKSSTSQVLKNFQDLRGYLESKKA